MVVVDLLLNEDLGTLLEDRQARGLNTEHIVNLVNVVRERAGSVHSREHHQLIQVRAVHIQNILLLLRISSHLLVVDQLVLDLAHVDTAHTIHACENCIEDLVLQESQHRRVLDHILIKGDAQNDLVCRLVRMHTVQNLQTRVSELGDDLCEIQNVTSSLLGVIQFETHNPRGCTRRLLRNRKLLVECENVHVLLHNRATGRRVIVDPNRLGNVAQSRALDLLHLGNRRILITRDLGQQIDRVARTLRVRRGRQQLLDTRNT